MNMNHTMDFATIGRYRLLFFMAVVLFPAWGPLMDTAVPGSVALYGMRFSLSGMFLVAIAATYVRRLQAHTEIIFFISVLIASAFDLYLTQVNDLHVAFVVSYQLLIFAVAICFETQSLMLIYMALVTAGALLVDGSGSYVPKAVFVASTATFSLIAAVTSFDRMNLVASLRRSNKALLSRDAYSRALIDSIPGAVCWVDRKLRYVGVNLRMASGVGLQPEDFIGKTVGAVVPHAQGLGTDQLAQMFRDTFASPQAALSREISLNLPHGGKCEFFLSCSKYENDQMAVLVALDITAQKQHEETIRIQQAQLVQSSKLSLLGEMSGGVAHEVNNPLAVIVGYVQRLQHLAKSGAVPVAEITHFSERILNMANRIAKIVQGLRTFAREASADPFETVSVGKIVQDTLEMCLKRFSHHGVEIQIGSGLSDLKLECRQVQISQVLLNLLVNAFDAVRDQKTRWIRVEAVDDSDYLEIRITDSGTGIESAIAAKMLHPFFTTKPVGQGTGLGLSISKGIVETHGGTLRYDSDCANTRFVVRLPKRQAGASAVA